MTIPYFHLAAQARLGLRPFLRRDHYAWLWNKLQNRFSRVAACLLMSDHVHLLSATRSPEVALHDFTIELRAFTRKFHPGLSLWAPVSEPKPVPNDLHLKRTIRYIHLNPCRDGLVKDPLDWEWSTHRDWVGAVTPCWTDPETLGKVLGQRSTEATRCFHKYVSSDPAVSITGTPFPERSSASETPTPHFEAIRRTALLVTRATPDALSARSRTRLLAAHLARNIPYSGRSELVKTLGVSERTLYRLWEETPPPDLLAAASLTLCDGRLLKTTGSLE